MSVLSTANPRPSGLPAPFLSSSRVPPALHVFNGFLLVCPSCLKECRLSWVSALLQTRIVSLKAMWRSWNREISLDHHTSTRRYIYNLNSYLDTHVLRGLSISKVFCLSDVHVGYIRYDISFRLLPPPHTLFISHCSNSPFYLCIRLPE